MPVAQLDDRAVVRILGADAAVFLQNVLTLDMAVVDRDGSGYGALLTPQGKILWDFILHRQPGGYAADVRSDQAEAFARRLELYKLRAKVDITPALELAVLASWGEGGERQPPSYSAPGPSAQGGEEVRADPRLRVLGSRWLAPAGSVASDADLAQWHARRIALAVPEGGLDFVFGDAFPHDAAMDSLHGVAFEKGCYIGQEVVSRMRHRGTARRRIVAVAAEGELPHIGAEIVADDAPLGRLGSSSGRLGVGLVRLDRLRAGLDRGLKPSVGGVRVALTLPAWATYGWPATAETAAQD